MGQEQVSEASVLVIGAGPAGLYSAQELAARGVRVTLLNRDLKPGGLAEYGIYHDKYRVKSALRSQFHKILEMPEIAYLGNVTVGQGGDITLDQLRAMGFDAIIVAVGAQGTKWLGLPGEHLEGVYHAKDLIYYYNQLPPFSERTFDIGHRVALIGVGNTMVDIAHWLVRDLKVDEVIAVARRGPAEVKFTRQEMAYVAANLDLEALDAEIERVRERMEAVGQDPEAAKAFILSPLSRAEEPISDTRLRFRFLSAPSRILGDELERVAGLEVENTALELKDDGDTRPVRLDTYHTLGVDTVIFCIGDRVSEDFGLPVQWFSFVKHPEPRYPIDGTSFEAYDPEAGQALDGIFIVGWARKASKGQVGLARKDALACVQAVIAYIKDHGSGSGTLQDDLLAQLEQAGTRVVTKEEALRLVEIEAAEAEARDDPGFKFATNEEMFAALDQRTVERGG
ncbi:MAG: FAD-dependent oxidoreductase [Anaerolineae bacterium]